MGFVNWIFVEVVSETVGEFRHLDSPSTWENPPTEIKKKERETSPKIVATLRTKVTENYCLLRFNIRGG